MIKYYKGNVLQAPDKFIVNAFTQNYYNGTKRQVSYKAVDSCMSQVAAQFDISKVIGMPKIGAGLGGGEWSIIEKIINKRLRDHDVRIYEL